MFGQNFAVCRPAILLVGFVSYPSHIPLLDPLSAQRRNLVYRQRSTVRVLGTGR
jgi:hypothetical protein